MSSIATLLLTMREISMQTCTMSVRHLLVTLPQPRRHQCARDYWAPWRSDVGIVWCQNSSNSTQTTTDCYIMTLTTAVKTSSAAFQLSTTNERPHKAATSSLTAENCDDKFKRKASDLCCWLSIICDGNQKLLNRCTKHEYVEKALEKYKVRWRHCGREKQVDV